MTEPNRKLKVFLCHATQDKPLVRDLYQRLRAEGWIDPWLDEEKLLPGMDWEYEIEKELDATDAVCVCISNTSVSKEGYVQRELRFVIDIALEKPEGAIYILPVRLEDCQPPRKLRPYHYADYFPPERHDWAYGRLLKSLEMRAAALEIEMGKISVAAEAPKMDALPPDRFTILGMEFVKIPAGKFLMGSNDDDKMASADEKPQHTLELPDYWMGRYPVTNEQYAHFLAAKKEKYPNEEHPVERWTMKRDRPVVNVSWNATNAYSEWLNQSLQELRSLGTSSILFLPSEFTFRLPTEAEWEKAARGPNGNIWPWGNQFDPARCNSREDNRGHITPVGIYSPQGDSPYGCADMAGNVWEWMQNLHKPYPYDANDGREDLRVLGLRSLRGGSWNLSQNFVRAAYRTRIKGIEIGFRLVLAQPN